MSLLQPSPAPVPEPGPESQSAPSVDLGPGPGINIAEEFGTAKRNLPPAKIVAIVLGVAAILLGIYAFVARAKPQGGGSVDNITAVEIPDQHDGHGGDQCHRPQFRREVAVDP